MDPDELRKSMIQEAKQAAADREAKVEVSRLLERLRDQGTVVRTRFRAIAQGPERRKLDEIYRAIDRLIGELELAAAPEDADEREERSKDLEKQADQLIDSARKITGRGSTFREKVEKGEKASSRKSRRGREKIHKNEFVPN